MFHNTTEGTKKLDLSLIPDIAFTQISFIGAEEATLEGSILTLGGQTSAILR